MKLLTRQNLFSMHIYLHFNLNHSKRFHNKSNERITTFLYGADNINAPDNEYLWQYLIDKEHMFKKIYT